MYGSLWKRYFQSVCSLNLYNKRGIHFFRSTGFLYDNYVITGCFQEEAEKAGYAVICFPPADSNHSPCSISITVSELCKRMAGTAGNGISGVIAISMNEDELRYVSSVRSAYSQQAEVGTPVVLLSYSRQISHLYIKTGLISGMINKNGEELIYIAASVEPGNAGTPVISAVTGKVIGVMTEYLSSSVLRHKELKNIINANIRALDQSAGKWIVGDIDPVQVFSASYYMIKYLAREIYLCSSRNSGYAVPIERVSRYLKNIRHNRQIAVPHKTNTLSGGN